MSRLLMAAAAALFMAGAAQTAAAADLPMKAPPPRMAAPVPYSWTGFYVGGFVGAGWGTDSAVLNSVAFPGGGANIGLPLTQVSTSGFLGGIQAGYNYQSGWVVWGIEGDFAGTDIKGTAPCVLLFSCSETDNWLATVSARVGGVVADRFLVYVKGGGAWLNEKGSFKNTLPILGFIGSSSATSTADGWLLGMGAEYAFTQNWSGVIEYDYMDFGNHNTTFPSPFIAPPIAAAGTGNVGQTNKLSTMKIGLNYKF
jgi:outer membrane immunogenic protein